MSEATDMEEQVDDVLFSKQRLKELPFVDSNRIGFLSWSLGGTAITKAAMVSNDIRCLLSFDGTEYILHKDTAWNAMYNIIKLSPPNNPEAITVPYLYLSSEHPKGFDSVDVFPALHIF
jgi:dienelactone hydrolase